MTQRISDRFAHDAEQVQGLTVIQMRVRQLGMLLPMQYHAEDFQPLLGLIANLGQDIQQTALGLRRTRDDVAQILHHGTRQIGVFLAFQRVDQGQHLGADVVVQITVDALAFLVGGLDAFELGARIFTAPAFLSHLLFGGAIAQHHADA